MNCNTTQNLLSAYLDAELSGSEMARIRRHLSACDHCSREEVELRSLKCLLTSVPLIEPPADFEEKLCGAIFGSRREEAEKWNESWPLFSGVALVTAALTLMVINHLQVSEATPTSGPNRALARELQRDQTYLSGIDPILGSTVIPINYGK
ncbi:MAG: hypothetical protein QOJ65_1017 [Fimbriimonadaceae bacterium]|jgi:anti-sigma factor RsiW|nr:hypothetical protein [Fimbriimonadaceae bacterium]